MAVDMKTFLKDYFGLRNIQAMPAPVLSHYNELVEKNDFPNDDVKSWKDKFMVLDSTGKKYIPKGADKLPDINELIDGTNVFELENLYLAFNNAFRSMAQNRDKYDSKVTDFIDKYFGSGKLFEITPIDNAIKSQITDFARLLTTDSKLQAISRLKRDELGELNRFVQKPNFDKQSIRDIISNLVDNIIYELQTGENSEEIENLLSNSGINLAAVSAELKKEPVFDNKKQDKLKKNYKDIFETLYSKSKIYDAFKENDSTISKHIDKALQFTDYTGKKNEKNQVAPKYKDDLNIWQRIDKFNKDTYKDVLKKYVTAHRDNVFIKPEAKAIFDALDKANIKPTDGLEKIIEQADTIQGKLKGKEPFKAAEQFGWMTKKLKEMQDNGYGKAISTALRNRRKMRSLIEKIAIDAVNDGKVKEAKTAMEVLSVMQYGLFDSRTMDAINKTDMTLFSDSGLSWNKNEGIQFVTKALDKTIKAGIQVAGYGITAAANMTRRFGSKLRGSEALEKLSKSKNKKLAEDKQKLEKDNQNQDKIDEAEKKAQQDIIDKTNIKDLDATKAKLAADKTIEANKLKTFKDKQADFDKLDKIDKDFENRVKLTVNRVRIMKEIGALKAELRAMPNPAPDQEAALEAEQKKEDLKKKQTDLQTLEDDITAIDDEYKGTSLAAEYNKLDTNNPNGPYAKAKKESDNAKTDYENQKAANDKLQTDIQNYEDATAEIEQLDKNKNERDKQLENWDKDNKNEYEELIAYWDFLQSGKTKTKLFQFATKKVQKAMDTKDKTTDKTKMQMTMEAWARKHGYHMAA